MGASTRALHEAIDRHTREGGIAYLHPDGPSVQIDLRGGANMCTWQHEKAERAMLDTAPWSSMPQIYSRYGTESGRQLIAALCELERAEGVVLTDCGMQAVALVLDALLRPGDHVLMSRQVYNKSKAYLAWAAQRGPLEYELLEELADLDEAIRPNTRLVFVETFTNPLMRALDPEVFSDTIVRLREERAADLHAVVDHTIATPWGVTRPLLEWPGIDALAASGTKALGGQDRDMWGYVASRRIPLLNAAMDIQAMRGGVLSWRVAEVACAGLPEAKQRFIRRCESAERVSAFLAAHPRVSEVFHPSTEQYPDRDVLAQHYSLPGSLLSFRVNGLDEDQTGHFCDVLATTTVIRYALSFDGLTTKVNHHKTVSEFHTPDPLLRKQGIDRLIRLGTGVEEPEDLIACLNWALWHYDTISSDDVERWQQLQHP